MYAALLSLTNNNAHAQTVCSYIIGLSIFVSSCSASYQSGHKRYTLLGSFYVDPYGSKVLRIPANAYMPPARVYKGPWRMPVVCALRIETQQHLQSFPGIHPRGASGRRMGHPHARQEEAHSNEQWQIIQQVVWALRLRKMQLWRRMQLQPCVRSVKRSWQGPR